MVDFSPPLCALIDHIFPGFTCQDLAMRASLSPSPRPPHPTPRRNPYVLRAHLTRAEVIAAIKARLSAPWWDAARIALAESERKAKGGA